MFGARPKGPALFCLYLNPKTPQQMEIKLSKFEADFLSRYLIECLEKLNEKNDIRNPETYLNKLFIDIAFKIILQVSEELKPEDYNKFYLLLKKRSYEFLKGESASDQ